MGSRLRAVAIAVGPLVLCGCETTTYFKEAGKKRPHGVLTFAVEDDIRGNLFRMPQVVPLEMNGLPPGYWTKMNMKRFNVVPGKLKLRLQAPLSDRSVAICSLEFDVEPDQVYSVQAVNGEETTRIRVLDSASSEIAACESKRQFSPQNKTAPLTMFDLLYL